MNELQEYCMFSNEELVKSEYTIIVRSVDENTTEKCIEYAKAAFGINDVILVRNVYPHQEMVKKCFELGIKMNRKWTVCIDADVILEPKALGLFIQNINYLNETDDYFFSATPCFYDYFFGSSRSCGMHIYKTELLNQGMSYISYETLRPETTIKRKMTDKGYKSYIVQMTVGVHDFFNNYESIMMKGLLHVNKHSNKEELVCNWKKRAEKEEDFRWLCKAVEIAEKEKKMSSVDAREARKIIRRYYPNIPERSGPTNDEINMVLNKYSKIGVFQAVTGTKKNDRLLERVKGVISMRKRRSGIK